MQTSLSSACLPTCMFQQTLLQLQVAVSHTSLPTPHIVTRLVLVHHSISCVTMFVFPSAHVDSHEKHTMQPHEDSADTIYPDRQCQRSGMGMKMPKNA